MFAYRQRKMSSILILIPTVNPLFRISPITYKFLITMSSMTVSRHASASIQGTKKDCHSSASSMSLIKTKIKRDNVSWKQLAAVQNWQLTALDVKVSHLVSVNGIKTLKSAQMLHWIKTINKLKFQRQDGGTLTVTAISWQSDNKDQIFVLKLQIVIVLNSTIRSIQIHWVPKEIQQLTFRLDTSVSGHGRKMNPGILIGKFKL